MGRTLTISIALVGVLGCGRQVPSPAEVSASRAGEFAAALARVQSRFGGAQITTEEIVIDDRGMGPRPDDGSPPPVPQRLDARLPGQAEDEALFRAEDGRLALSGPDCLRGGSCGCDVPLAYKFLRREDGRVAIVRMTPVVETIKVEVESCGYGCGQPAPPRPVTAALVPVTDVSQLEVIDAPYRYVEVIETCAHPMPRP